MDTDVTDTPAPPRISDDTLRERKRRLVDLYADGRPPSAEQRAEIVGDLCQDELARMRQLPT